MAMIEKRGPRDLTLSLSPPQAYSRELPESISTVRFEPYPRLRHASVRTSTYRAGLNRRITSRSRRASACLAFFLAACQTPAVQTRTVEVKIPVAVQPIKPEQVPALPAPLGPRPQSLSAAADMLLADHCKWVAYGLLTDPLLKVSSGQPPKEVPRYPECER